MSSKRSKYEHYIEPDYDFVEAVNPGKIREEFDEFTSQLLAKHLPETFSAEDPYLFESNMGGFLREIDRAKDHFVKALLAKHAKGKRRRT